MKHIPLKTLSLRGHKTLTERWVHDTIAADPTLLGLGDVIVKDRERIQPGAGRLDLLLQEAEGNARYAVEIQLGPTDPSHIIRTIEYWDKERRRYSQYDYTAVIIAEDITSRFLNVISLFNGSIPIMAIQMKALEHADGVGLLFTRVLDTVQPADDEEDDGGGEPTDRNYWETRASTKTLKLMDEIRKLAQDCAGAVELSYNKHYVGLWVDGRACNFAYGYPRKAHLILHLKLPSTTETDDRLDASGLTILPYDKGWKCYRLRLLPEDFTKHRDLIGSLMKDAYALRSA